MIVERMTVKVKKGCMQEAVALCKSFDESAGITCRTYTSRIGPDDTLVRDHEFESLAEMERFWKEWSAKPDSVGLREKGRAVTERGGTTEIWDLVD